jgi:hypothetical protein
LLSSLKSAAYGAFPITSRLLDARGRRTRPRESRDDALMADQDMRFSTYAGHIKGVKEEDSLAQPSHDSLVQVTSVLATCDYDIKRNGHKNKLLMDTH